MFNNSDMSDISLTCEGSDKTRKTFYAHKYVLGTSSDVFHAMFYGGLAEKGSSVHLSDTNEEALEQFLRFLYAEECTLTADNVISILYLARKYIVPSLSKTCVNFLIESLNAENVLDVLDHADRFDENGLKKRCWKVIQSYTSRVAASESFNNISQTTLTKLLMQNNLNIEEVELFEAVSKWIDFQCSRKDLEPTPENRRSVIGKAIYGFRFFSMGQAEFVQHISKSGLLTSDELVPIYEKFIGIDSPALKWKLPNRKPGNMVRFPQNDCLPEERPWEHHCSGNFVFSVDKDVLLLGVRLFGLNAETERQVTLEVKDSKVSGTYMPEVDQDGVPGFDVMLKKPVMVKQNDDVTIAGTIIGPSMLLGPNAYSEVTLKGVTATFDFPSTMFTDQFQEIICSILY